MKLADLLQKKKAAIADRWLDRTLESYASRTSAFLKRKKDQFANPVGHALRADTRKVVDDLVEWLVEPESVSADRFCSHLEDIIKVRSVQEFSPSQAVSFVFYLRQAIREELREELEDPAPQAELARLDVQIDQLALYAFDIYSKSREKLYELRINEIKRTGYRLLKKANLISIDDELESAKAGDLVDICRPRGGGP
jgi:hypothetical protein